MGYPRKALVSLSDTPYYHVVARCVRRAWLWGVDEYAGKDYSHRKDWILERLAQLAGIFAIDVCAYAVMSNHYHLVLHIDQDRAWKLTEREVVERYTRLFATPSVVVRYLSGNYAEVEADLARAVIAIWRARLSDMSWFMKCLNEHLARRANAEDHCTGKFWEGRFKSQALVDEPGLLTAMVYVDLNPMRAGVASTPEESQFTSIAQRIRECAANARSTEVARVPLRGFQVAGSSASGIPYTRQDYLELVDWSGRIVHPNKRGVIDARLPSIMQRLNIDAAAWTDAMQPGGNLFGRAMGRLDHLRLHAKLLNQSWIRGVNRSRSLYTRA
jgi:REP element-mobilizing transposase RayT